MEKRKNEDSPKMAKKILKFNLWKDDMTPPETPNKSGSQYSYNMWGDDSKNEIDGNEIKITELVHGLW